VIHADIFSYAPGDRRWDVVGSFGLVEHFDDPAQVIRRHLELLVPGGYLVLAIPNHAGINGQILDRVDRHKSSLHNHMSYEDLERSVRSAGSVEILEGGYFGHFGFWNTGIYGKLNAIHRGLYLGARLALSPLERLGALLPDTKRFSPNSALIARKVG
jgi:SAM-dependent methyltransferase